MQIFTVNITLVMWPHVTNVLDLRYFCEHNHLFYHQNLIPGRYWSWQRNIDFLVNIFVRHTFPMLKSSIKTKTVLTMADMTKSTELRAFIRKKDGYKVTVKIPLCICVVLSWDELEVRQNLLDSDYEIYMVRLLVATVNWHKSLQFVKKIQHNTLTLFIYDFISCFDDHVNYALPHSSQIWVPVYISSLSYYISCVTSVTQKFKDESTSKTPRDGFFSSLPDI